ncbi:MAG: substrate-binding domain-containing protein [Ancalomicrobiaceae bacterium]|nr:substrate-binding domain-containing protein [Ancalomicrobiaceae bacterium]
MISARWLAAGVFALGALSALPAALAEDLRFAVIAPIADSPFFQAIENGCTARSKTLAGDGSSIACLYAGPGFALDAPAPAPAASPTAAPAPVDVAKPRSPEDAAKPELPPSPGPGDAATPATPDTPAAADAVPARPAALPPKLDTRTEAQIVMDFVAQKVDGIALSPADDADVRAAIAFAVKSGIPVVTFDADAPTSGRSAFVGTNARDFGRSLGASLKRWKPKGGKYAILATDPAKPNLAERIIGVRDAIGRDWQEIVDSPIKAGPSYADTVKAIDHLLDSYSDVDAVISVGAWPMLATDDWRALVAKYKSRIDKAQVVLVVADALPLQKDLVREGLGHVLVGQRPSDMGARVAELLYELKHGRKVPEVVYVGFNTFTRLDLVGQSN